MLSRPDVHLQPTHSEPSYAPPRLSKPSDLVPAHLSNRNPSYFLVGGLVFTVACEPYLESEYGDKWSSEAPVRILDALFYGMPSVAGQQVVLLSQVLADESTLGYEDMENVQVGLWLERVRGQGVGAWGQISPGFVGPKQQHHLTIAAPLAQSPAGSVIAEQGICHSVCCSICTTHSNFADACSMRRHANRTTSCLLTHSFPGYCLQILAVNGTSVTNLQHLAQLVTSCTDEFLQFTCDYCETVVVRRQQAVEGTQTVLLDHSIPAAMSQDIQQVLNVPWPSLPAENGVQQHEQVGAVAAAAVDGTGG